MAARKVQRVGNAALYIGLPWEKRKSLPRDSQGFEPIDEYFRKNANSVEESDSSDTDVEELLKQEKERRREGNARKRAQLEARKQAAKEAAAAQKNSEASKPGNEEKKNDKEVENVHTLDTTTVAGKEDRGQVTEDGACSQTANGLPSEESAELDPERGGKEVAEQSSADGASKYSPEKSVAVSPDMPPPKVIPTRLTFSASPTEGVLGNSDGGGTPKSTGRKRRVARRSILPSQLKRTTRSSNNPSAASTVVVENRDETGQESENKSAEHHDSVEASTHLSTATQVSVALSDKSLPNTTTGSFHPKKTSTQIPRQKSGARKKQTARKVSSILPVVDISDSDSDEADEMLQSLLGRKGQSTTQFKGLHQLAKSRAVEMEGDNDIDMQPAASTIVKKPSRSKSTVKKGERKPGRKSVTFSLSSSPAKVKATTKKSRKSSPKKLPSTEPSAQQNDTEDGSSDVYDFVPSDEGDEQNMSTQRKGTPLRQTRTKSPEKASAKSASILPGHVSIVRVKSTQKPASPAKSKKSATVVKGGREETKRKSILKEVSVVVARSPSVVNLSHGQWFVPEDISSLFSRKSSLDDKSQIRGEKSTFRSEKSMSRSEKSRTRKSSRTSTVETTHGSRWEEDAATGSHYGSGKEDALSNSPGSGEGSYFDDVGEPPDSAGSKRGESAFVSEQEETGSDRQAVSKRPSQRKRKRIALATKPKRRKQGYHSKPETQENPVERDDEGEGEHMSEDEDSVNGLDITYSAGGRRYRRIRLGPKKSHTPGVRRSQRTRIAPVKYWENEEVEYDTRRRSGVMMKAVLIPLEDSLARVKKRKRVREEEENQEFPPLKIRDRMGNVLEEMSVVSSLSATDKITPKGSAAERGDEVVIAKLHTSSHTTNGLIIFSAFGEKAKCKSGQAELFFYVLKGKVLFSINSQEFKLQPNTEIRVPQGTVYAVRNLQRSQAEVFFYTVIVSSPDETELTDQ